MDEDFFDCAQSALEMLEIAAMAYETGRADILEQLSANSFDRDEEYDFAYSGMYHLCDFMKEYGSENSETVTMYFSSNTMMEYYRLCRTYSKLRGVPLNKNQYMLRAQEEICDQMSERECYYCTYYLQTKINHQWSSGIVFKYDASYFCEFPALFSRLLYVFEFYNCMVKELRQEVEKLQQKPLLFPTLPTMERRVA